MSSRFKVLLLAGLCGLLIVTIVAGTTAAARPPAASPVSLGAGTPARHPRGAGLPPLPALRPTVEEPRVSAQSATSPARRARRSATRRSPALASAPIRPATQDEKATSGERSAGVAGSVTRAVALPNGVAVPPLQAPDAVRQIIQAGDAIARTPYVWGGGHGRWLDRGYDCSGSVSFVLAAAGLLGHSQVAADFMGWGDPGPGRWVTIYAKQTHVFMRVAGIRFDTVARAQTGSRWVNDMTSTAGFVVRHPPGL